MGFVRTTFAVLLGVVFGVGGVALHNHRIALQQAEAALADRTRMANDQARALAERTGELGKLSTDLEKANASLVSVAAMRDELAKQKRDAESRAALYNDFVRTFQRLIDAGRLELTQRHGRIVIALPSEVLFNQGKSAISPEGRTALAEIAKALKDVKERRFQVAGHTDNVPIHTSEFPSNWELSSARAVEVVKLLVTEGVDPSILSGTGYAEFQPLASNASAPGRAKNRRIEITLETDVTQLMGMPQMKM